jgi:unsaturated chondroitin disaccharide hydrolase
MADLNKDGKEEVIVPECTNNVVKIYSGKDTPEKQWEEKSIPIPELTGKAKSIEVGDVNNDGVPDFILSTETRGQIKNGIIWLNGKYLENPEIFDWQIISGKHISKFDKVELKDLDEDGDLDVLTCEENFGEKSTGLGVVWYENPSVQKWTLDDVQKAIDYCEVKSLNTLENLGNSDKSPRTIPAGETHWEAKPPGGWTSGFWAGVLWYVYEGTGNEKIKTEAEKFTSELKTILNEPVKSHDLGFIFNSSFGNGYRLTQNEEYKKVLQIAADSLTHLFNPKVGTILSWPAQVRSKLYAPHNTIIDNMMNLELLFEASKKSGNPGYSSQAVSHADVTLKNHIRPDSTLFHVLVYDDKTGECIRKCTHQGYADNSVWARGQAWGIYGYTMCYRETGDEKYLQTAKELTAAYLKRLPEDYVPYWDFDDPEIPNTVRDASAAAIVASALLNLSELVKNETEKEYYRNAAEKMLWSLSSPAYLSGTKNDAFLLHSTSNKPKNGEVDIPIIYADYYYIEALVRLNKILTSEKIN